MTGNYPAVGSRYPAFPLLILVLLALMVSVVLAGCDNQPQPTAKEAAAHDAKKKDTNK